MTLRNTTTWLLTILGTTFVACGDHNVPMVSGILADSGNDVVSLDTGDERDTATTDTIEDTTVSDLDTPDDTPDTTTTDTIEDTTVSDLDTPDDTLDATTTDTIGDSTVDTGTDAMTTDADTPDEPGSAVLCSMARRCDFRVVETCDPATGIFSSETVCERDQRCRRGTCEALPAVYGTACRGSEASEACEAAGLACGGFSAVTFCLHPDNPQDLGEDCYGMRDCNPGVLCTRTGRCSAGAVGDPCLEPADCSPETTGCGTAGFCF
jgi:hypothetical protein